MAKKEFYKEKTVSHNLKSQSVKPRSKNHIEYKSAEKSKCQVLKELPITFGWLNLQRNMIFIGKLENLD